METELVKRLRNRNSKSIFGYSHLYNKAADRIEELENKIELAVSNLRHAYPQLAESQVIDQKQFADGLIAPTIRNLENALNGDKR